MEASIEMNAKIIDPARYQFPVVHFESRETLHHTQITQIATSAEIDSRQSTATICTVRRLIIRNKYLFPTYQYQIPPISFVHARIRIVSQVHEKRSTYIAYW